MPALLASLLDLCRFRRGPGDMPYAPRLLVALLVGCGVLQALSSLQVGAGPDMLAVILLGKLVVLGALFLLLRGRGKTERFVQTAMALSGAYLLFGVVMDGLALALPLQALREQLLKHPAHPPTLTGGETLVLLVIFALGVWQLCVWVRILRLALEVPWVGAVLVFLLLLLADWIAIGMAIALFGVA